jgi:hypothetical protein
MKPEVERIDFERNRLPLPTHLVKNAVNSGLTGADKVDCWLIFVSPGRFRLAGAEAVSRILNQVEVMESPGDVLDNTESDLRNACPVRLIHCTVSPPPPLWRLNFPQSAALLVSEDERPSYVFGVILAGFIELWFPDTLRRALSGRLSDVLS